jgi:hypothetical protein
MACYLQDAIRVPSSKLDSQREEAGAIVVPGGRARPLHQAPNDFISNTYGPLPAVPGGVELQGEV